MAFSKWLEPAWRSDLMLWTILGVAVSLAFETGVFDKESRWQSTDQTDIFKRLGWCPPLCKIRDQCSMHLNARMPPEIRYGSHQLMWYHAQKCHPCKVRSMKLTPEDDQRPCPLKHPRLGLHYGCTMVGGLGYLIRPTSQHFHFIANACELQSSNLAGNVARENRQMGRWMFGSPGHRPLPKRNSQYCGLAHDLYDLEETSWGEGTLV